MSGQLPAGWQTRRLGDLAVEGPTNGYSGPTAPNAEGTPTLRLSATTGGSLILNASTTKRLAEKIPPESDLWLHPGDLLVQRSNTPGLVGTAAVYDGPPATYVYPDLMMRLRLADPATTAWVCRYMNGPGGRRFFSSMAAGSSGSMPKISGAKLRDMVVPLPPLPEQRRLAAILDEADALRRKRREALALLDDLLQSVFRATVGDANPRHRSWPERTIETLAAPGGMRTGPFGSALLHSEFVDDGVAVLGIDNAVQNRFTWAERRFVTYAKYQGLKRYRVYAGDVVVTIMGTTGRAAVVPPDVPLAITTKHLAAITPNLDVVLPQYLANAIHRDADILRQIANRNRGAIMDGLNLGIIRGLVIRLPPLDEQRKYTAAVESIETERLRHEVALAAAEALFASLLHRAFSGGL